MKTSQHRTTTAAKVVKKKNMTMIRGLLVVLVAGMMTTMTMTTTHAFSPATPQSRIVSLSSAGKTKSLGSFLMMSSSEEEGDGQKKQPAVSADGTFYDDEVRIIRIVIALHWNVLYWNGASWSVHQKKSRNFPPPISPIFKCPYLHKYTHTDYVAQILPPSLSNTRTHTHTHTNS